MGSQKYGQRRHWAIVLLTEVNEFQPKQSAARAWRSGTQIGLSGSLQELRQRPPYNVIAIARRGYWFSPLVALLSGWKTIHGSQLRCCELEW